MSMEPEFNPIPDEPKRESIGKRLRRALFGKPRDLAETSIFHRLSLIPILAWIGLGADGLSSSSYGPEEAFRALNTHMYLALGLALGTALTVTIIATAYSRIIEEFPGGGGGYMVASKLLGKRIGVVSGCALLVDYVLTIAVSITAAGDALFSTVPLEWHYLKFPLLIFLIVALTILNIRGVRESVLALAPIFFLFLITHAVLITVGIFSHVSNLPAVIGEFSSGFKTDYSTIGIGGMLSIFIYAYSLGGGTYTGLEAVSNGMPIMREPRVHTGKRTMLYMAISLSLTAAGLLVCYLLWNITPHEGKTLNAVLAENVATNIPFGNIFVILTLLSAGAILIVGAQAGFLDGPRVLSNMAVDSWMPHRFSALSERLTTMNGIVLMGAAALAILIYTGGNIHSLVVMYSINVFLTFSLSMLGMWLLWYKRKGIKLRKRRISLFTIGFVLCSTILVITMIEKFSEGGWVTLFITGSVVLVCFIIHAHYKAVWARLEKLNDIFTQLPAEPNAPAVREINPKDRTAAILVGSYSGLGIHTLLAVFRSFPKQYQNLVFISVGLVDSGEMKGAEQIQNLHDRIEDSLKKYTQFANNLGYPATYKMALGTDVVDEAMKLCLESSKEYSQITFFAGKLVFKQESWMHGILHNQTAFSLQRRLWWEGQTMVVLPVRVR
jgi:amino acid transporter